MVWSLMNYQIIVYICLMPVEIYLANYNCSYLSITQLHVLLLPVKGYYVLDVCKQPDGTTCSHVRCSKADMHMSYYVCSDVFSDTKI